MPRGARNVRPRLENILRIRHDLRTTKPIPEETAPLGVRYPKTEAMIPPQACFPGQCLWEVSERSNDLRANSPIVSEEFLTFPGPLPTFDPFGDAKDEAAQITKSIIWRTLTILHAFARQIGISAEPMEKKGAHNSHATVSERGAKLGFCWCPTVSRLRQQIRSQVFASRQNE